MSTVGMVCVCVFNTVSSSNVTAPCPSPPLAAEHPIALSRSVASISGGVSCRTPPTNGVKRPASCLSITRRGFVCARCAVRTEDGFSCGGVDVVAATRTERSVPLL